MARLLPPTLSWYLALRYFSTVVGTTCVLGLLVLLLELLEMLRRTGGREDIGLETTLMLVALKMPTMLLTFSPFAILIGTLVCFSSLAKKQELTIIRASGQPARHFLLAPLITCLLIGIFNVLLLNPLAAVTLKKQELEMNRLFPGSTSGLVTEGGSIWLRQPDANGEIIIFAQDVQEQGRILQDASFFFFNQQGKFTERIDAATMELRPNAWHLQNVLRLKPGTVSERWQEYAIATTLKPDMIGKSFTSPLTLTIWELPRFIQILQQTGFQTSQHVLHLHKTIALPALFVAMFLLAAPLSLHFSRNSSLPKIIITGLCFGFLFHFFTDLVATFGLSGRIGIELAAWIPTLVAMLLGAAMFIHFREE